MVRGCFCIPYAGNAAAVAGIEAAISDSAAAMPQPQSQCGEWGMSVNISLRTVANKIKFTRHCVTSLNLDLSQRVGPTVSS